MMEHKTNGEMYQEIADRLAKMEAGGHPEIDAAHKEVAEFMRAGGDDSLGIDGQRWQL